MHGLALYQGEYFDWGTAGINTVYSDNSVVELFKYAPAMIDGFAKKPASGTWPAYYCKNVKFSEIDAVFFYDFFVLWHDVWCRETSPVQHNYEASAWENIRIQTNNSSFAEQHKMLDIDRGQFEAEIPLAECQGYKLVLYPFKRFAKGVVEEQSHILSERQFREYHAKWIPGFFPRVPL